MAESIVSRIRWGGVIGAGIASFVVGGVWYAALFVPAWQEAHGFSQERMDDVQSRFAMNMAIMVALDILRAGVLAAVMAGAGKSGLRCGVILGALLWTGISLPYHGSFALSAGVPIGAFAIDASYRLVALLVAGAIVGQFGVRSFSGGDQ